MMGFISLTTPLMLLGLGLLALPVIAHVLNRRSRRQVVFPSIELLLASAASQSQLVRLRRWLLLLLRCLIVALLVAAFARPVWVSPTTQAGSLDESVAVLLLIDVSASTAQQTGGIPLIESLRASAVRALDGLRPGTDLANIVYADSRPYSLFPQMSPNLPAVRAELENITATMERAELAEALTLAGSLLSRYNGRRRLVIVSDLQQSAWGDLAVDGQSPRWLPPGTQVTVIDPPSPAPGNVAVVSPRCYPARLIAGQTAAFLVQVANFSGDKKQVPVSASLNARPLDTQTIELEPGQQTDVAFEATVGELRPQRIEFSIPADGLAADNHAYFGALPLKTVPVIVVSDDDPDQPGTGSYFLTRSLAPRGGAVDSYAVHHVRPSQLPETNLNGAAAVFVEYIGVLTADAARILVDYVRGGGGLIVFNGEGAVRRNLLVLENETEQEFLPWMPGQARDLAARDQSVNITGGRWRSRLLRDFDEQSQIALTEIQFGKLLEVVQQRPGTQVLLNFSDGTPALACRPFAAGQVVLANFSPAVTSSDLGKYGSFVALTHMLAKGIRAEATQSAQAVVGQSYLHSPLDGGDPDSGAIQLVGPQGVVADAEITVQSRSVAIHLARVPHVGFYNFRQASADRTISSERTIAVIAANVDPRESNLTRIEREQLENLLGWAGDQVEMRSLAGWQPIVDVDGKPLWGWAMTLAMICIGVELALVGWWRR